MTTDHVSEADTHAAIAKRLGMKYGELLAELDFDHENAHAIIRDRAAEALRKADCWIEPMTIMWAHGGPERDWTTWILCGAKRGRLRGPTTYETALLAALDLAGIGGDDD